MLRKERLKLLVKSLLGVALVIFVIRSKMVDFEILRTLLFHPANLLIALLFLLSSTLCCTGRWLILVRAQGLRSSFWNLFSLSMIGNFFNTFMPGSVGGDLIKAWYIAGQEPKRRTRAVFTVLLDRVLGLAVIIFYAALTLLFYTDWLNGHEQLKVVAYGIWAFTACSVLVAILFYTPFFWKAELWLKAHAKLSQVRRLATIVESAMLYQKHRKAILKAFALSAISVFGLNILYSILGKGMGIPMTLAQYFVVVPLALTASAIPLLPGGIGTGQVAFFSLFKWMGIPNPDQGGTLCTLMQFYWILFNCMGYLFYLKYKKRSPTTDTLEQALATPALQ